MTQTAAILARVSPAYARVIPFGLYIAFLAAGPSLAHMLPDGRWLYAIQVGAVALALAALARHYAELRGSQRDIVGELPLAVAVGVAVFVMWINLDQPWATLGQSKGFDPRDAAGAIDWPLAVVRIFGAAVIVPVMEELFWRSFIMRWIQRPDFIALSPRDVALRGLLGSSLLFGVEHALWLAGILAGIAYGWLYMRRGNLWSPIVAHGVTNFLLGAWVLYSGNWQFW